MEIADFPHLAGTIHGLFQPDRIAEVLLQLAFDLGLGCSHNLAQTRAGNLADKFMAGSQQFRFRLNHQRFTGGDPAGQKADEDLQPAGEVQNFVAFQIAIERNVRELGLAQALCGSTLRSDDPANRE